MRSRRQHQAGASLTSQRSALGAAPGGVLHGGCRGRWRCFKDWEAAARRWGSRCRRAAGRGHTGEPGQCLAVQLDRQRLVAEFGAVGVASAQGHSGARW